MVKRITQQERAEVLSFLDKGIIDAKKIAQVVGITKMQVAAVKAWRTMGKY